MKIIEIQRHFFTMKDEPNKLFFCKKAESDSMNNAIVLHYVRANRDYTVTSTNEMTLRGKDVQKARPISDEGLGMAYNPASDARRLGTQTPDSMGYDIHEALKHLIKAVGNVTDFVCERLQWSRAEIEERLFAEQVDAVALAIYNFEARNQAMIIGDQTGIGKGRIASSMIRYALVHGYVPVYCTENAGLFSDNYRDIVDIGCGHLIPFIINSQTSGQSDARIMTLNDNDENVSVFGKGDKGYPITDKKLKDAIYKSGKLPEGYDYILTTYSQLKNAYKYEKDTRKDGEDKPKFDFLMNIAPNAVFIFDESHNISGSKVVQKDWSDTTNMKLGGSNQFYCFNELAKKAKNVIFLSATFAKRAENLVVYANRTCIAEAGLKEMELISAISDGGEALQEVISSDIVHEGQMIRRESVYDDIEVNYIYLDKVGAEKYHVPDLEKEHRAKCDFITEILNRINIFEKEHLSVALGVRQMEAIQTGEFTEKTSHQMGVSHIPIFSKLFNIVNQLLFAIKAQAVADHAIRRLKENKKVVIGLSSTMESFLDRLRDDLDMDVDDGADMKCDFTLVLEAAVEATMRVKNRDLETGRATGEVETISLSELTPEGQEYYLKLCDDIRKASSGITLSPIDLITQKIEEAGYKVSEVTGRKRKFIFSNADGTKGKIVPRKYVTRNVAFSQFQNNQSDVLIINASGATGASAHATTKNTNLTPDQVKARVMIIAQTELDVNKEVQKRGRINRTGQIRELLPSYDYLTSAIPAEKRLMMMLQKKLKSLDANSTSNQKQSTTVIDTSDFMNKYGNKVCAEYLRDNEDINEKLNNPVGDDGKNDEGVDIQKVTGYVPLLTCQEQEDFYNSILDRYNKLVESLKAKGEYDLEVEAMDLDAELVGKLQMLIGPSEGQSKFSDAVYLGNYNCKILRKPYTQSEIRVMLSNYLQNEDAREKAGAYAKEMRECYDEAIKIAEEDIAARYRKKIDEYKQKIYDRGGNDDDAAAGVEKLKEEYKDKIQTARAKNRSERSRADLVQFFHAGRACIIDSDNTKAICLGTEIGNKTKAKWAGSNVEISFAVASSAKLLTLNLVKDNIEELSGIKMYTGSMGTGYYDRTDYDAQFIDRWSDYVKEASGDREMRQIIVGNTLRAYKQKKEGYKLVSFTTKNGEILKGLLVPKKSVTNENGETIVMSKYPIGKFYDIIKKQLENGERMEWNVSRGVKLIVDDDIEMQVYNKETFKKLNAAYNEFALLDYRGRTFTEEGWGSYKHWSVKITDRRYLSKLITLLEDRTFTIELMPSQVDKYFPAKEELKTGNWKPLKVDMNKIPKSVQKVDMLKRDDADKEKAKRKRMFQFKLKLALALTV